MWEVQLKGMKNLATNIVIAPPGVTPMHCFKMRTLSLAAGILLPNPQGDCVYYYNANKEILHLNSLTRGLARKYTVLVVMDPSRLLSRIPKPGEFSEWVHVDVLGGQRYLDDEALCGFVFLDQTRRPKDLVPLRTGELPLAMHEKVCASFRT